MKLKWHVSIQMKCAVKTVYKGKQNWANKCVNYKYNTVAMTDYDKVWRILQNILPFCDVKNVQFERNSIAFTYDYSYNLTSKQE